MKRFVTLALILLCVSAAPNTLRSLDDSEIEHEDRKWSRVATYEVPTSMVDREPNAGAHGASVVGFKVNREAYGSMIVTVIDRPALAAFVGWEVPKKYASKAAEDLRAVFETADGTTHVSSLAAGGGHGILFHSPDGVDISTIRHVALYYDKKAKWSR
ncbi:MAG: hypothetical protein DHS20C15_20640 [Planctomycetota bacterium]|nr:MAG: hypothetical protein DHS20C15_20640 [Planctomycetota bacterium]